MSRSRVAALLVVAACGGGGGRDAGPVGDAAAEACPPGVAPTCYSGPAGTDGVGICHAGVPRCEGGEVVECVGAVLPGKSDI